MILHILVYKSTNVKKKFFFEFSCKIFFSKNGQFVYFFAQCLGKVTNIVKVLGLGVGLDVYSIPEPNT